MSMRERLIRPYVELHRKLDTLADAITELREDNERIRAMLRHVYDEEPANRRRLYALRESEEYELAFTEKNPLVTFVVSTYTSYKTLRDVALPSILGQSYENLDVVVVGDSAPPETAEVISELGDSRVRYYNRAVRGPYPEGSDSMWWVVGTPPYNEGVSRGHGRWIASLSDDDAIRPEHTEVLIEAAQEHRYEACYGHQLVHFADGHEMELSAFPPQNGQWGFQAAIYHAGLRFMEMELADAIYDEPNDWSLCRRMLAAGVRFGMIDRVVADKYERRRSAGEWRAGNVPDVS